MTETVDGRLRADAQRNRESLLAVAREVLAEEGVETREALVDGLRRS